MQGGGPRSKDALEDGAFGCHNAGHLPIIGLSPTSKAGRFDSILRRELSGQDSQAQSIPTIHSRNRTNSAAGIPIARIATGLISTTPRAASSSPMTRAARRSGPGTPSGRAWSTDVAKAARVRVSARDRFVANVTVYRPAVRSYWLPSSVVDAFRYCLFRSAPEISHHQRRHDGHAGHQDPIRNGRDSDRDRRKAHRNHPGTKKHRLDIF